MRRHRTIKLLRVFSIVFALGFGLISLCVWRGDSTSPTFDVVHRIAGQHLWAAGFALGAAGFAVEAVWPSAIAGWRVWTIRVGVAAVMFTLIVRGVGILLSPVFGNGTLIAASPGAIAWLMLAALIVIHMWSREGIR